MNNPIYILGYGSLIWDLDDLAPKILGEWRMNEGPSFPLEFSRISPKRKQALVVVIDPEKGDPCPSHAIRSIRGTVAEAADDLAARERTTLASIGWVDLTQNTASSHHAVTRDMVTQWCTDHRAAGAVWTDLDGNYQTERGERFTVARAIAYLKTLTGASLAEAEQYITCAPAATDTPLRRALAADPWWQDLTRRAQR